MTRSPVRLDIFSDPVCPWCYLGKAHLDRALADAPDHPFVVEWHPFRLNPDMPPEGQDRVAYLTTKFGADRLAAMSGRLRQIAAEAGVEFDPDAPARAPQTLDAHRLIHWAGIEGRQGAVVDGLFRAYWVDGRDISDPAVLADVGKAAGMDRAALVRLLASDADAADIAARDADARAKGVSAVPTFLVARTYAVSGAQPPQVWAQVIAELQAQAE